MDLVGLTVASGVGLLASAVTAQVEAPTSPPEMSTAGASTSPAIDRWSEPIAEASRRFGMPDAWIRAVMRVESGGNVTLDGEPITSSTGAMGLMQLMPATYDLMRQRYGLGDDPYDPHDNILAGAAFMREMYDRFGAPAFLAAYNAGPARFDDYRLRDRPLPRETTDFVASVLSAQGVTEPIVRMPLSDVPHGVLFVRAVIPSSGVEASGPSRKRLFFVLGQNAAAHDFGRP